MHSRHHSLIQVRLRSDSGQTQVRHGLDTGQTRVRHGSDSGQTQVRLRSDSGQTQVRHGSDLRILFYFIKKSIFDSIHLVQAQSL